MPTQWYPRRLEHVVKAALQDSAVVCLVGPRQVGKTTLARKLEPQRAYINFDDASLLQAAKDDPIGYVESLPGPVILDEIQRVPELLPAIKMRVDEQRFTKRKQGLGQFLLTGSANLLLLPKVNESLAGRMQVIQMHPLSELEKQGGQRDVLSTLLAGELAMEISPEQNLVTGIAEAICAGGYPEPSILQEKARSRWYRQYINALMQRDANDIAVVRDQDQLHKVLTVLAHRTASLLNVSSLANDLQLDRSTAEKYVGILERLFLVRRLPAWHRNNAKRLIKSPKLHVLESGLASHLNRLSSRDWQSQSNAFGPLLESFVVQQLICQASWQDDELWFSHYRDKDQVEVDLVIERGRDVWGVEVKRTASVQPQDGAGLMRLAAQAGKNFRGGILFYSGPNCLTLQRRKDCFAVPLSWLWQ